MTNDVEPATSTPDDGATPPPEAPTASSRRDLVTKGALAATIAAVAGGALSSRVHAANGSTMFVGESDTGTETTQLSGGTTFQVDNGTSSGDASLYGLAGGSAASGLYGVRGANSGSSGAGVYGTMNGSVGQAVHGEASGGAVGVRGEHTGTSSGTGVLGITDVGTGVRGQGGTNDIVAAGSGKMLLSAAAAPAPAASGNVGTIARDADGALWYCYAANMWHKLSGPSSSGTLHTIAPARVYDSRPDKAPLGVTKGRLDPGDNRVIDCTVNASGVPAAAKAVILNLTAAAPLANGNLAVYPDGSPAPDTSTVNYQAGSNIANSTSSGCGAGATVRVQCGATSPGGTDFIVDVVGYYL